MSPKKKLTVLSLVSLYPLFSTFLMTFVWQIAQNYMTPLFGGYYFKWVFLYTENNDQWLSEDYLLYTRILYFVYLGAYLALSILTLLVLFRRRGKAVCLWCICGLWLADCGWVITDLIMSGIQWQLFLILAEHLVFIVGAVLISLLYLKMKKTDPELFRKRKSRKQKIYRRRFQ